MSSSTRTLICGVGVIVFLAILVLGIGVNYVLAGSPDADNVEAKIRAAVLNGDMTREQATEKLEGLRTVEDSRRITLEDVEARLKAGVDAGGLTQGQADARLEAWKKDQAEGQYPSQGRPAATGTSKNLRR
ncbi:MAG: hypothetical protein QGF12_02885 [SAR202 cluster bacterium]|nr:hypothetical protein [SAR202 cluster bacterium]